MSDDAASSSGPKHCFVVMGFGLKTDYATGRQLDLNKSYRLLIKPVVEEKGLVCVRADEIRHSGAIDVPMYQELLTADVVIADLSTANPNALYELGLRHALRPRTTIVISESKLPYPFDLNHVAITSYTHLGDAIDFDEVVRFRRVLGDTLQAVLEEPKTDSPVYTFLSRLTPPCLGESAARAVAQAGEALKAVGEAMAESGPAEAPSPGREDKTLAVLIDRGEEAIEAGEFADARTLFALALKSGGSGDGRSGKQEPYLLQRLALTTYKAEQPDPTSALNEALAILAPLDLENSNDPETVGLAGAIEKRLFELGQGTAHLDRAIAYYARSWFLRNDIYGGINLAHVLNVRTDTPLDATDQERIADLVWANRIRKEILALCEQELAALRERRERGGATPSAIREEQERRDANREFWCLATEAGAYLALGQPDEYRRARAAAEALAPAPWMRQTLDRHIRQLTALLAKHGHLLNPPWPAEAMGG